MAANNSSQSVFSGHFISAPGRSSGKSLCTMGLSRYASRSGLRVQTFKKGPDYIDPLWLKAASDNSCYNLDPYTQTTGELLSLYQRNTADLVLVEGTMGLHDGLATDGSDSNAAVAGLLGLPVLLVMDCRGLHRTIAALVNGLTSFDPSIDFSGVILNRVRTARHAAKIERAIDQYCDIPLLGKIAENQELAIEERELGLVSALDNPAINHYADRVADVLQASCDLHTLMEPTLVRSDPGSADVIPEISKSSKNQTFCNPAEAPANYSDRDTSIRVGLARDEAFHFYYEDDLQMLGSRGIELVEFSPLRDNLPEGLDGLLIGGGFPERHLQALTANTACRSALAEAINGGLPVRAECGGLMYLCKTIETTSQSGVTSWPMVGAMNGIVSLHAKPQGRGYMKLRFNSSHLASSRSDSNKSLPAHEFHHSSISFDNEPDCLFDVKRGYGLDGLRDGVCVNNLVASYAHLRHTQATPWIDWFLDTIRQANYGSNSPVKGLTNNPTAGAMTHV